MPPGDNSFWKALQQFIRMYDPYRGRNPVMRTNQSFMPPANPYSRTGAISNWWQQANQSTGYGGYGQFPTQATALHNLPTFYGARPENVGTGWQPAETRIATGGHWPGGPQPVPVGSPSGTIPGWVPVYGQGDASLLPQMQAGVNSLWNQNIQNLLNARSPNIYPNYGATGPYAQEIGYGQYTHPGVSATNVYNASGKGIGHLGKAGSGTVYYGARRSQGKNYTQIREQAQAAGNWDKVQRMLQRRRETMKWRGIGAGRPPETKGLIPMPGGNAHPPAGTGGGGGTNSAVQPTGGYWQNSLINWRY